MNSLISTTRIQPASGNGLQEILENFELRSEINQIAKISELASFWDPIAPGRILRPRKTWMMVLEVLLQHAENTLVFDMIQKPHFLQQYLQEQYMDQLSEFESHYFLVIMELTSKFHLQVDHPELLGW